MKQDSTFPISRQVTRQTKRGRNHDVNWVAPPLPVYPVDRKKLWDSYRAPRRAA